MAESLNWPVSASIGYLSPGAFERQPWPQGGGIALKVRAPLKPN